MRSQPTFNKALTVDSKREIAGDDYVTKKSLFGFYFIYRLPELRPEVLFFGIFLLIVLTISTNENTYGQASGNKHVLDFKLIRWAGKSRQQIRKLNIKLSSVHSEMEMEKLFLKEQGYLKVSVLVMINDNGKFLPWFGEIENLKKDKNTDGILRGKSSFAEKITNQSEFVNNFEGTLLLLDKISVDVRGIPGVGDNDYYLAIYKDGENLRSLPLDCTGGHLSISSQDLIKLGVADGELRLLNSSSGKILLGKFRVAIAGSALKGCIIDLYQVLTEDQGQTHLRALITIHRLLESYGKISPSWLEQWLNQNKKG